MWQEDINAKLAEACTPAFMPAELTLPEPLLYAFDRFDASSSSDPRAFAAVQAITGWALGVVGEIAAVSDELADRHLLKYLGRWKTEQTTSIKDVLQVRTLLRHRGMGHEGSTRAIYYQFGRAMAEVALQMEATYSLNDDNLEAPPHETDLVDVVVRVAILIHIHRDWCGPEASEAVVAHLADHLVKL